MKEIKRSILSMSEINKALATLAKLFDHYNKCAGATHSPHEQGYYSNKCIEISNVRRILWELI